MSGLRRFFILLSLTLVLSAHTRLCFPTLWRILYSIKTPAKALEIRNKLLAFKEESDDALDLSADEIASLPMFNHGQNQYVYEIPQSEYLVKIAINRPSQQTETQLRSSRDYVNGERLARSLLPDIFPPEISGVTKDGYFFKVQKKISVPTLWNRKYYLLKFLDDFKKSHPNADIELDLKTENYFISINVNNVYLKIGDLTPDNIGIHKGKTVIIDGNIYARKTN